MKDFLRGKLVTVMVVVATVILAGVAIFTALRLYQLRQHPVAPTAPESRPAAHAPVACEALAFTITTPTPSPTPTEGPTPSEPFSPTATPTPTLRVTPTSILSPTPTSTPTPTTGELAQASSTPTTAPELPSAGVSVPTILGVSLGLLLLLGALLFIF